MHISNKIRIIGFGFVLMSVAAPMYAYVFDNQYLPLLWQWPIMPDGHVSSLTFNGFAATGSSAVDNREKSIGIPEIYGMFDLGQFDAAFETAYPHLPNPLPSSKRGLKIPYRVEGKIQAQGASVLWYQQVCPFVFCGANFMFLNVNGRQEFRLKREELGFVPSAQEELEFDEARRQLFAELGFANRSHQIGFGDTDLFVRAAYLDEYVFKLRRIDVGLRTGLLIPTGKKRVLLEPNSIPFGGNGMWGMYVQADGLLELKEDLKFGFLARVSKRFSRVSNERLSVEGEPNIYGVLSGPIRVNPGVTLVFSPSLIIEGLRAGLGLGAYYTLIVHHDDGWRDVRPNQDIPIKISKTMEATEWGKDIFTAQVFYDFGKTKPNRCFDPIISFKWDIPALLYVSKNTTKVNQITVGIECVF